MKTSASPMEKQIRSNRNKMIGVVVILIFLASWQSEFLYKGIKANLYVNGTIIGAFLFSVIAAFLMVLRLKNEVLALNALKEMWGDIRRRDNGDSDQNEAIFEQRYATPATLFDRPRILGHAYDLVTDELARTKKIRVSLETMQTLVHKIEASIAEERSLINYMSGLLVFMGLIGTFMGLLKMVGSIGAILGSLQAAGGGANDAFQKLLTDLQQPLAGMTTGFASSLFGLMGSLVVGLLARFAGSAAAALKVEFEAWLATVVNIGEDDETDVIKHGYLTAQGTDPALAAMVDKLVSDYHAARIGFDRTETAVRAVMETQQRQAEIVSGAFEQIRNLAGHQAATAAALNELKVIVPHMEGLAVGLERFGHVVDQRLTLGGESQRQQMEFLAARQNEGLSALAAEQQRMAAHLVQSLAQNRDFAALVQGQLSAFVSETSSLITSEREALRGVLAQQEVLTNGLKDSLAALPQSIERAQAESGQTRYLVDALSQIAEEARGTIRQHGNERDRAFADACVQLDQAVGELRGLRGFLSSATVISGPLEQEPPASSPDAGLSEAEAGNPFERSLAAIQDAFRHVLGRADKTAPAANTPSHTQDDATRKSAGHNGSGGQY